MRYQKENEKEKDFLEVKECLKGKEKKIRREFLSYLYEMCSNDISGELETASRVVFQMADALVCKTYLDSYSDEDYGSDLRILCNDLMNALGME